MEHAQLQERTAGDRDQLSGIGVIERNSQMKRGRTWSREPQPVVILHDLPRRPAVSGSLPVDRPRVPLGEHHARLIPYLENNPAVREGILKGTPVQHDPHVA